MDKYIHYLESMKSLNGSWRVLKKLQTIEDQTEVWMAAYRMCLIDYCKPFKKSNGANGKLILEVPELPQNLQDVHDYVIKVRDKILAHSDLEPLNVKIINREYSENKYPPIICTDIPNFPVIELMLELVEAVIIRLTKLEKEFSFTKKEP